MSESDDTQAVEPDYKANVDALDGAIRKYTAENCERKGIVVGWVVLMASTRFGEEGETLHAYNYTVGPGTDLFLAHGLMDVCRDEMKAATLKWDCPRPHADDD